MRDKRKRGKKSSQLDQDIEMKKRLCFSYVMVYTRNIMSYFLKKGHYDLRKVYTEYGSRQEKFEIRIVAYPAHGMWETRGGKGVRRK